MRTFLRDYDWEQAFQNIDVNTKWDHFKAVVNSAVQRFVPISTKKRNRKLRWMSKRTDLARRKNTIYGRDTGNRGKPESTIYMRHTNANTIKPRIK